MQVWVLDIMTEEFRLVHMTVSLFSGSPKLSNHLSLE